LAYVSKSETGKNGMHILGDRGRGYEDDDDEGYAGNFPEGGGR